MAFVTFEGLEGCGKSTQARLFAERLGPSALLTREPGATELGRSLRKLLLDPHEAPVAPAAEALLYFADKAQHVVEVLEPALAEGRTVVCDRYVESALAYQGGGRGLSLEALRALAALATGGLRPDAIVFLDIPIDVGLDRVHGRERGRMDRIEGQSRVFHERVLATYRMLIDQEPSRWIQVNGLGPPEVVAERVWKAMEAHGLVPVGASR